MPVTLRASRTCPSVPGVLDTAELLSSGWPRQAPNRRSNRRCARISVPVAPWGCRPNNRLTIWPPAVTAGATTSTQSRICAAHRLGDPRARQPIGRPAWHVPSRESGLHVLHAYPAELALAAEPSSCPGRHVICAGVVDDRTRDGHARAWRLAVSCAVINHSCADHMPPWAPAGLCR